MSTEKAADFWKLLHGKELAEACGYFSSTSHENLPHVPDGWEPALPETPRTNEQKYWGIDRWVFSQAVGSAWLVSGSGSFVIQPITKKIDWAALGYQHWGVPGYLKNYPATVPDGYEPVKVGESRGSGEFLVWLSDGTWKVSPNSMKLVEMYSGLHCRPIKKADEFTVQLNGQPITVSQGTAVGSLNNTPHVTVRVVGGSTSTRMAHDVAELYRQTKLDPLRYRCEIDGKEIVGGAALKHGQTVAFIPVTSAWEQMQQQKKFQKKLEELRTTDDDLVKQLYEVRGREEDLREQVANLEAMLCKADPVYAKQSRQIKDAERASKIDRRDPSVDHVFGTQGMAAICKITGSTMPDYTPPKPVQAVVMESQDADDLALDVPDGGHFDPLDAKINEIWQDEAKKG